MKDRFWTAYFYVMWFVFLFGLFLYVVDHQTLRSDFGIGYYPRYYAEYMMLSAIPMTIIRWVGTGKHFWNRP